MNTWMRSLLCAVGFVLALAPSARSTPISQVDWLALAPTPFGVSPPAAGYPLAGLGTVQLTYTGDSEYGQARVQNPALVSGSVTYSDVRYAWTNHETLGRTHGWTSEVLSSSWEITYRFSQTVAPGRLIVGIQGLGRRNPAVGESPEDVRTTALVIGGGTYLGDWKGGANYGPTTASVDLGGLSLVNALSGPGEANPWWNTGLALIRIDVPVNSLTVRFNQTRGDGVGINIGAMVPEPASALLLVLGGALGLRRSRRAA